MNRRIFLSATFIAGCAVSVFPASIFADENLTVELLYDQIMNSDDKSRKTALQKLEENDFDAAMRNTIVERVIEHYDDKKKKYTDEFASRGDKLRFIGGDIKRKIDIASSFAKMETFESKHFSLKNVAYNFGGVKTDGLEAYVDGYPVGSYPVVRSIVRSDKMKVKDIVDYIKSQSIETEFHDEDAAILFFLVAYKIKQTGLTFEEGKKYLYGELKDWKDETSVGNPARVELINKIRGFCQDESLTYLNIIRPQSFTKWPWNPVGF